MFKIVITTYAARRLKKLGANRLQKKLLTKAIDSLGRDPKRGYPLRRELKGFNKLRVGDFRVVYEIRHRAKMVVIVGIGHRKDVYETLARRARMI